MSFPTIDNSVTNPLTDIFEGLRARFFPNFNIIGEVMLRENQAKINRGILAAKRTALAALIVFVVISGGSFTVSGLICSVLSVPSALITIGGIGIYTGIKAITVAVTTKSLFGIASGIFILGMNTYVFYQYKNIGNFGLLESRFNK